MVPKVLAHEIDGALISAHRWMLTRIVQLPCSHPTRRVRVKLGCWLRSSRLWPRSRADDTGGRGDASVASTAPAAMASAGPRGGGRLTLWAALLLLCVTCDLTSAQGSRWSAGRGSYCPYGSIGCGQGYLEETETREEARNAF